MVLSQHNGQGDIYQSLAWLAACRMHRTGFWDFGFEIGSGKVMMTTDVDIVVIGAGAAGLMCASTAGKRGRRVLLVDHVTKLGEKIRISAGGGPAE